MRKRLFLGILTLLLMFTACDDKKITTVYSTGCIGFTSSYTTESKWQDLDEYMDKTVDSYNKTITFESETISENDNKAASFVETQMTKVDKDKVSSFIKGNDTYIYGIRKANANGSYTVVKAYKFDKDGCEEYKD